MPNRLALVIAVDSYQEATLPPAAHAETDAVALSHALEALGFARDSQVLLLGSLATKTAIESRLRKLVKNPPHADAFLVFFAGHGLADGKEGVLTCFDTQTDDLPDTGVALSALLDALRAVDCERVILFLDDRGDVPAELLPPGLSPHLPTGELRAFVEEKPGRACFLSCQPAEVSWASGLLKGSIWTHHLVEALTGKAPLALENGRLLTALSLRDHLTREVPRTLRATFRDNRPQTPTLFNTDDFMLVADVGTVLAHKETGADPRLQQLKRGSLRTESTGRVKDLAGYRKFHRLPDRVNAASNKFVADLAAEDVKDDVDSYYALVREHLGYKRRDVESSADRGSGFVRTPDFEYSVSVSLAPDDPTTVIWRREVAGITNPEVVMSKAFGLVFGSLFDTLVFEFVKPFDLEAWVDHVEEAMPEGVKLRCASDCSSCDVTVAGFPGGVIRLYRDRVEIQGGKTPSSQGLVEAFLGFQDMFAGRSRLEALPLNPGSEVSEAEA
jgi:hypothetical protein